MNVEYVLWTFSRYPGVLVAYLMRFFGWYLAAVLAAYALSASWSLGLTSARLSAAEQEAARLSDDLDAARAKLIIFDQRQKCAYVPDDCLSNP